MQIPPKVFPLRPLVGCRTRALRPIADNPFMRRCDPVWFCNTCNAPLRARGPAIMLNTIDEPCVEDQVAKDKTTPNQREHHAGQAATEGTARFNGASSTASGKVIDLSLAGKGNYVARRGVLTEIVWFFLEAAVINNKFIPVSAVRVWLLRRFGARIGSGCRMPHPIRVKAPWNLEVGDNCWFGWNAWIYNQALIRIGSNVCISQEVFLTTGSHDLAK